MPQKGLCFCGFSSQPPKDRGSSGIQGWIHSTGPNQYMLRKAQSYSRPRAVDVNKKLPCSHETGVYNSFIHSPIHSSIHSSIQSFMHPFSHSLIHSIDFCLPAVPWNHSCEQDRISALKKLLLFHVTHTENKYPIKKTQRGNRGYEH